MERVGGMTTIALLAVAATAPAEDLSTALAQCRAEKDEGARLACYDRLVDGVTPSSKANTAGVAPPPAEPARDPAPPTAETPPPAAGAESGEEFGYRGGALARAEAVAREEAQRAEEAADAKEVSGTVTEVSRRPRGELVITLDNGQTWVQKAPDASFVVKYGDAVRIEAGTLGSFTMYRADSKRGTRVTRVR